MTQEPRTAQHHPASDTEQKVEGKNSNLGLLPSSCVGDTSSSSSTSLPCGTERQRLSAPWGTPQHWERRLPAPRRTSASCSSAEMLTKFKSGDSTGVDCGNKWERRGGKKSIKLFSLKKAMVLHEGCHPPVPLHQRRWHWRLQARGACPLLPLCQGPRRSQTWKRRCRC